MCADELLGLFGKLLRVTCDGQAEQYRNTPNNYMYYLTCCVNETLVCVTIQIQAIYMYLYFHVVLFFINSMQVDSHSEMENVFKCCRIKNIAFNLKEQVQN